MAVLSVPLRGAEVERVPLGSCFRGQINCAGSRSQLRRKCVGRQLLVAGFRDRTSARAFLPIQPCIQVRRAETPHFPYMGAVNLSTSRQLLQVLW
jgi:hypothetical protein